MNGWAENATQLGSQNQISFDVEFETDGTSNDPVEYFVRADGWATFVAAKPTIDSIEVRYGGGSTTLISATLDPTTSYNIQAVFNNDASIDVYLNSSHIGTAAGNAANGFDTSFDMRSQKGVSLVDNLSVTMVPEPASLVFAGLGGCLLLARRNRR